MGFYPIVLELTGRRCLVVGGGPVAERKVAALLDAEARVTVVSPCVTAALQAHARTRRILLVARRYRRRDVAGQALVFVATEDYAVLASVTAETRRELRSAGIVASSDAWRGALDGNVRRLIAAGKAEEAKHRLVHRLRGAICV